MVFIYLVSFQHISRKQIRLFRTIERKYEKKDFAHETQFFLEIIKIYCIKSRLHLSNLMNINFHKSPISFNYRYSEEVGKLHDVSLTFFVQVFRSNYIIRNKFKLCHFAVSISTKN